MIGRPLALSLLLPLSFAASLSLASSSSPSEEADDDELDFEEDDGTGEAIRNAGVIGVAFFELLDLDLVTDVEADDLAIVQKLSRIALTTKEEQDSWKVQTFSAFTFPKEAIALCD